MGIIHTDCPHCHAAMIGMPTFGAHLLSNHASTSNAVIAPPDALAAARCPICSKPVGVLLTFRARENNHASAFHGVITSFAGQPRLPESYGMEVKEIWPKPLAPEIPRHMPSDISNKLLEAEQSFRAKINTGAASLYRAVIDTTTKRQLSDASLGTGGTLEARIRRLSDGHIIPNSVAEWAHEVRVVANEGLHDEGTVARDDAEMVRSFALTYLRYAFELPGDIAARRPAQT